MRLAIISDVHGNVRALEAVLADIRSRGVDATVNLGDCVAGPTWPRESFECLATLNVPTVRGNHDRWIADRPTDGLPPAGRFAREALTRSSGTRCSRFRRHWSWRAAFSPRTERRPTTALI